MATVPSFTTFVAGAILTAAQLNTNIRDAGNFWLARPLFIGRATSGQSLTNITWTDIDLGVEDIDRDGGHSTVTNTARYTSPTAGYLLLAGGVSFVVNATGMRGARWALNGTAINGAGAYIQAVAATDATVVAARTIFQLVNGTPDYVTLQGFQRSGGALSTSAVAEAQSSMHVLWVSTA